RRAWERGWPPADLVRYVRRELDERRAALAAALIAAETARYAELPPRWRRQLAELPPPPPRNRPDRFSYAADLLELYRLLLRLPAVEPAGPLPGAPADRLHRPPAADEPRMLTRIRALLAKAEATGFPEEAEALTAKAQELMARHTIDEALLAARSHSREAPGACRLGVEPPYESAKAVLLDAVASANRCRAVWNDDLGFSTVVGFEPDLEAVELLFTSLLVQGATAMTRAEAEQRAGGRKRTKTFRQAFWMGYAQRLGGRLAADAERVTAQADTGTDGDGGSDGGGLLPVLAARDVAVADTAERMFPRTTTTRLRGVDDPDGWHRGTEAADRARVGGARDGSRRGPDGEIMA
ncbi:aromatic acid decarboxylase, partial [Streptomyces griseus subsp. griseus]